MRRIRAVLVSLMVLGASAPLHAQDVPASAQDAPPTPEDDARARVHFQAGTDSFERGDYENALRELEIAHEMSRRPEMYFNLGSCLERLGRFAEAADRFEQYLASGQRADAELLSERIARLRARARAGRVEETGTEPGPPGPDAETDAGPEPATTALGETSATLPAPGPETPPETFAQPRGRTPHVASWITLGVGGAGLVAFGVLGGLALAEDDALTRTCGSGCTASQVSGLESLTVSADVSLVAGLVLAATGVVLALTTDEGSGGTGARLELGPGTLRATF